MSVYRLHANDPWKKMISGQKYYLAHGDREAWVGASMFSFNLTIYIHPRDLRLN